tara:strand:+ start:287 stop:1513 length:1227 start_codon:yes stop_codon:yes gene_type:complete
MKVNFTNISEDLIKALNDASREIGINRIAIVGGIIRDDILRNYLQETIELSKDLDICLEGSAHALAQEIKRTLGKERVSIIRINQNYLTVEMQIDNLKVDIATARKEIYPSPGENPKIFAAKLEEDLGRRDFTINSLALDLTNNNLVDLYNSKNAIHNKQLEFIHSKSVEEDPTRIIRGARYAGRLGLAITPKSLKQIKLTINQWPWRWRQGQKELNVPPALGTRLKMELELLFQEKSCVKSIAYLKDWGALVLLDKEIQNDQDWGSRMDWALRLGITPLTAFIAKSSNSKSIAKRLQLPQKEQDLLESSLEFQEFFSKIYKSNKYLYWKPSDWCIAIEKGQWNPDAVAIAICIQHPLWKYFFEWLQNWKRIESPIGAKALIEAGWVPGPLLKKELQRLRFERLDQLC